MAIIPPSLNLPRLYPLPSQLRKIAIEIRLPNVMATP